MTLLKFKPRTTGSIPNGFTSLIDELLKNDLTNNSKANTFEPRANILENEKAFEIQLELAGFNKKNIIINVENEILTIKGENVDVNNSANGLKYHVHQINKGKFQRSFYLPDDVSSENVEVKFENGILYIWIQKDEVKQTKRTIDVG